MVRTVVWSLFLTWIAFSLYLSLGYGHYVYLVGAVIGWVIAFKAANVPGSYGPYGFFLKHARGWALFFLLMADFLVVLLVFGGQEAIQKADPESPQVLWFVIGATVGLEVGAGFGLFRRWSRREGTLSR